MRVTGPGEKMMLEQVIEIVSDTEGPHTPKGDPLITMLGLIAVELARLNDLTLEPPR